MTFEVGARLPSAHADSIWAVRWCREAIITASLDAKVRFWQPSTVFEAGRDAAPTPMATFEGHSLAVVSVDANPSGTMAASSSMDGSIITYDLSTLKQLKKIDAGPTKNWSVSLTEQLLATGGHQGAVSLFNYQTAEPQATTIAISDPFVLSVRFSSSGDRLAVGGSKGQAALFDPATGQIVEKLHGHTKGIRCIEFAVCDSNVVLTGSEDNSIGVFDVRSGHQVGSISAHNNWVMGLASQNHQSGVERFASCSTDKTVKVWELRSRQLMHSFDKCHSDQITAVAFSPFSNRLVSVSDDASIQCYDMD